MAAETRGEEDIGVVWVPPHDGILVPEVIIVETCPGTVHLREHQNWGNIGGRGEKNKQ